MQGYVRVTPKKRDDAVIWWCVREYPDGFVHARGGRVRTTRDARNAIRGAYSEGDVMRRLFVERPVAILEADGSLTPIDYGPYGPGGSLATAPAKRG
jgi:hypothetical protein